MNRNIYDVDASDQGHPAIHFSPRETEVLPLLLKGYSSKEIARELHISPRTVDIYRSAILAKLRIRKTTQLFYAVRQMNIPFDECFA